jgi:hypothetical protein
MNRYVRWLSAISIALFPLAASALRPADAGLYIALNEDGEPVEKVIRVSQAEKGWKFEDRQPDGSWLDVSCHGGCEHRESTVEDLVVFFGAPPPPHITPDCVHNMEYAFCHLVGNQSENPREGYVLVVRAGADWFPISMKRMPDDTPSSKPPLQPAHWRR